MGIYLHFGHYWSESVVSDFIEMPKIFHYTKSSLQRSDGIWWTFSFHKNCHFNGVRCKGIPNILRTSPSLAPPAASRDDWAVRASLYKSDGSPNPASHPNPPSISLTRPLLCLHLHWPLPRRTISGQR